MGIDFWVGRQCFGTCDEYFDYETLEEALEAQWDQTEPGEPLISVLEGEVGPNTFYDNERDAELYEVIKVKERVFKALKDTEFFEFDNLVEITQGSIEGE